MSTTTVTLRVRRSDEWVEKSRLEFGTNIPKMIDISVPVADLSARSREILLAANHGEYNTWTAIGAIRVTAGERGARLELEMQADVDDSCGPRVLDEIIRETHARGIGQIRSEEAERAKLAEARELLAEDLAEIDTLRICRDRLANFVAEMPHDAKLGALRSSVNNGREFGIEQLKQSLENSCSVRLFGDEEEGC